MVLKKPHEVIDVDYRIMGAKELTRSIENMYQGKYFSAGKIFRTNARVSHGKTLTPERKERLRRLADRL